MFMHKEGKELKLSCAFEGVVFVILNEKASSGWERGPGTGLQRLCIGPISAATWV